MTKQAELDALARTIATFGPHSYIGPWLAEYRAELEALIRSDFPPSVPLPTDAREQARAILEAAELEARRIQAQATDRATAELEAARAECQQIRESCRAAIGRLLAHL